MKTVLLIVSIAVSLVSVWAFADDYVPLEERNRQARAERDRMMPFTDKGRQAVEKALQDTTLSARERKAVEDSLRAMDELKKKSMPGYRPPQDTTDYSKYSVVFDYKNVFFGNRQDAATLETGAKGGVWQHSERERFRKIIANSDVRYVVLPVQEFSSVQDIVGRVLSAQLVVQRLAKATGENVLSADAVQRVFGWTSTLFQERKVYGLFNEKNPLVVHLYLRHAKTYVRPGEVQYDLAVVVSDCMGKIVVEHRYPLGEITLQETLEKKVGALRDTIVADILGQKRVERVDDGIPNAVPLLSSKVLTGSFADQLKDNNPLHQAALFQLLARLGSGAFMPERTYLFMRSFIALEDIPSASMEGKVLKSRALFALSRRPQALELLKGSTSPAATAYRAYLNGNYPELKEALGRIENPTMYALAYLDYIEMCSVYQKKMPEFDYTKVNGPWAWLLMDKVDRYTVLRKVDLKRHLAAFRELSPEVAAVEKGVMASLQGAELRYDDGENQVAEQFIRSFWADVALESGVFAEKVGNSDIKTFYSNLLAGVFFERLYRLVYFQGDFVRGVAFAEKRAGILDGQPQFNLYFSYALAALSSKRGYDAYMMRRAYEEECVRREVTYKYETLGGDANKSTVLKRPDDVKECAAMYLVSPQFPADLKGFDNVALRFAKDAKRSREETKKLLENRFVGNPKRTSFLADELWNSGKADEAVRFLQKEITPEDQAWLLYATLGNYQIQAGYPADAEKTYLAQPVLESSEGIQQIQASNNAYNFGWKFLVAGDIERARRFFIRSAEMQTGSGFCMNAAFYLAQFAGDYEAAAQVMYQQYDRDDSDYGYAKYYLMKLLLQDSEEDRLRLLGILKEKNLKAWGTDFLWNAVLADLRKQGGTPAETLAQIEPLAKERGLESQMEMFTYLIQDRVLSAEDKSLLDGAPVNFVVMRNDKGIAPFFPKLVGNIRDNDGKPLRNASFNKYGCLYSALLAMQNGRYDEAVRLFVQYDVNAGDVHLLSEVSTSQVLLPMVLEAIAKSTHNTRDMLQKIVAAREEYRKTDQKYLFPERPGIFLARAVASAAKGEADKALLLFRKAWSYVGYYGASYEEDQQRYCLVAGAEQLTGLTGDRRFIDTALEKAQDLQTIAPWLSWPYAFEALYCKDREKRVVATSRAMYLDKESKWLSLVPEDIRKAAAVRKVQFGKKRTTPVDVEMPAKVGI